MRTASTDYPDPVPDAPCGIYNDPDDERICVCARDPNQCGKRVPAANLAHPQGKLICCLYITAIVVAIVLSIVLRLPGFVSGGGDEGDDPGYCDDDCDAQCAERYGCRVKRLLEVAWAASAREARL